ISPDAKWFTFRSKQLVGGTEEIFIQSTRDAAVKYQITTGGGFWPRFSTDGSELYYVSPIGDLTAVHFSPPQFGKPEVLFHVTMPNVRSEERRVGKEWRSRWWT